MIDITEENILEKIEKFELVKIKIKYILIKKDSRSDR
jgi:hypothetical protein